MLQDRVPATAGQCTVQHVCTKRSAQWSKRGSLEVVSDEPMIQTGPACFTRWTKANVRKPCALSKLATG